jgi:hypothetical protein
VKWNDSKINHIEINEMLEDLWSLSNTNPTTLFDHDCYPVCNTV